MREKVTQSPYTVMKPGMNVLGIIVFSLVFGGIIGQAGEKALALKLFIQALEYVIMGMVRLVIW